MTIFPDMKTVLTIGSLQVTWYAVLILSGAFLAYFLSLRQFKKWGYKEEVFENFLAKLEVLKEKIGIKKTIREYGIDERYFLDTLDEMVEQAFNDQCTGANPRYPLIAELKEIYLKAYYGK